MCGIAGVLNLNNAPVERNVLERMNRTLSHRGPDDEGYFLDGNLGLANKRLAIIDTSSEARQPMHNEDQTLCIVSNGEIYNYLELAEALKGLGHVFKSHSDTEVILHSYEEWGASCVDRFIGMWAFAIWDRKKKSLFLSRDRFGIKPFYYFLDNDRFIFASEIKAILEYGIEIEPNRRSISRYLIKGYGYTDTNDETFFAGIRQLKPAHNLRIGNGKFEYERYWSIDPRNKVVGLSADGVKERFRDLFKDAVRMSMRSDVPLGIALSGGLDSSSLAAVMSQLATNKIETFSAYFDEEGFDERSYINEMLKDDKFIPNFISPKPRSLIDEFERIVWHQDEPYSGASVFSQWKVMEAAKTKGIKVLLTGQGGDEILAGYHKYYPYYFLDLARDLKWDLLAREFNDLQPTNGLRRKIGSMAKIAGSRMFSERMKRFFTGQLRQAPAFLKKDFLMTANVVDNGTSKVFASFLDQELYDSMTISPLPALLHIDDRNSMAHSVESRPPFLDHRLVEFVFSLPYELKISNGITKHILREALKDIVPHKIITRRDKKGFATPMNIWFGRELKDYTLDIFNSPEFAKRGIFDKMGVDSMLNAHFDGERDHSCAIWSWINLELWFRKFMDGKNGGAR